MGFFDFLKGVFKDAVNIKIDARKIDNRRVVITKSEIVCGNKTIKDPKLIEKFYEELEKYKKEDTFPFQLVHNDLADELETYEELSIKEKEGIKKLKESLPSEDVECILMARRVILANENDNQELFRDLLQQLEKNYSLKGKKIFNLMSTGYFDELILPMTDFFTPEDFKKFFDKLLKFFPIAVFVGNMTTIDKIKAELSKRLQFKDVPVIRIHAMGEENIKKVKQVMTEMEIEKEYNVDTQTFVSLSKLRAQITEIKLKK